MDTFDFTHLRVVLSGLPDLPSDSPQLDFRHYVPSLDGLERTESINGAVNYDLERILGFKCNGLVLSENAYISAGLSQPSRQLPARGRATLEDIDPKPSAPSAPNTSTTSPLASTPPTATSSKKRKSKENVAQVTSVPPWVDIQESFQGNGQPANPLVLSKILLCSRALLSALEHKERKEPPPPIQSPQELKMWSQEHSGAPMSTRPVLLGAPEHICCAQELLSISSLIDH
ncbi:hypothetical protein BDV93DRAFT_511113 [Ceratobasidium sp. AG-I]|nr:hypothetical protein BDV93DRAFT_511113 [Ceratobasidium sp. AG-I]